MRKSLFRMMVRLTAPLDWVTIAAKPAGVRMWLLLYLRNREPGVIPGRSSPL